MYGNATRPSGHGPHVAYVNDSERIGVTLKKTLGGSSFRI
jgi:hypothetical protein